MDGSVGASVGASVSRGGAGGGWRGPSQPSCRPRMYSFHVCRPRIKSPRTPSHSLIPLLCRASAMSSSSDFPSASFSISCLSIGLRFCASLSPFPRLSFLIFSASSARTSPSRRPSITSQSSAPATKIGLTYS